MAQPNRRSGRADMAFALGVCALLFLEHLAFGAGRLEVALVFAALQGGLLTATVLASPGARDALARGRVLLAPALLLGAVFIFAFWSLTPWAPGGSNPVWAGLAARPAAAIDKSAVGIELIKLAALACVFLLGWIIAATEARARFFLGALMLAGGGFAVMAFFNFLLAPATLLGLIPTPNGSDRLAASFLNANTAATFFAVNLVLTVCAVVDRLAGGRDSQAPPLAGLQRSAPYLALLAFTAVCLALTASRAAVIASGLGMTAFLVWEGLARRWRLKGPAGLGLAGLGASLLGLLLISGARLFGRVSLLGGGSTERHAISQAHWRAFFQHPWLGYGLGGFNRVNSLVATEASAPSLWNIRAAHNVYLQWLEGAGLLGALAMFACIAWVLGLTARAGLRRSGAATWLRGLVAASLVLLIHGGFDFGLQIPSIEAYWACLLGVGAGLAAQRQERQR